MNYKDGANIQKVFDIHKYISKNFYFKKFFSKIFD